MVWIVHNQSAEVLNTWKIMVWIVHNQSAEVLNTWKIMVWIVLYQSAEVLNTWKIMVWIVHNQSAEVLNKWKTKEQTYKCNVKNCRQNTKVAENKTVQKNTTPKKKALISCVLKFRAMCFR